MIIYRLGLDVTFRHPGEAGKAIHLQGVVNGKPIEMEKVTLIPVYVPANDVCLYVNERNMLWKFRVGLVNENDLAHFVHRRVLACDAVTAGILAAKDRRWKLKVISIEQLEHVQ